MDLVVFEYDQNYVLECFRRGEFDFVDGVSEVAETEFFRYIGAKKILGKLAETYPSPARKKKCPCGCTWPAIYPCGYTEFTAFMRIHM